MELSKGLQCVDCSDWSEQCDQMAGKLSKALLKHCLQQGWLRRHEGECALEVAPLGRKHLAGCCPRSTRCSPQWYFAEI